VDAFDDPNAESDLAVYRTKFGLPPCTTANGCFKKVNQYGGTVYPFASSSWAEEISLDLDMVSAVCPNCHILLVEAFTSSFSNLGAAVNTAVSLGANTVSNSYGGSESSSETSSASNYNHPGTVITASSGDSGFGAQVPAAYNTVVAVGGTSLSKDGGSRGWSETAWSGAGSGCSAYISKPSWQTDPGCSLRTVADVSAVADPHTGVSVYDTYGQATGWMVFGGTSVSSPIIASVYALAGNASSVNAASSLYSHTASLYDVTSGSNGSCGGSYLCTAGPGYDGPTGLGTPNGTAAF
jgi:subtilase family serine protease